MLCVEKKTKKEKKIQKEVMVPKGECIYYLDGVWRVWMQYEKSTFWHGKKKSNVRLMKWSEGYCPLCVIKIKQTSHPAGMDFISVSLQITVLFVYVLLFFFFFFSGGHRVALFPPQSLYLLTELINVMWWITVSIVWVFWRYTNSILASGFIIFFVPLPHTWIWYYVSRALNVLQQPVLEVDSLIDEKKK